VKTIHIIPAILLLGVCLIALIVYNYSRNRTAKEPVHAPLREDEIHGIDLSHYSGRVDFDALRAQGYEFVFLRSSMGIDGVDRNFHGSMRQARRAGFKTGVYHFFRFGESGTEQARHFLSVIGSHNPDLPVVLDVEEAGINASVNAATSEVVYELKAFLDYLKRSGHERPIVYSNRKGYWKYLHDHTENCHVWIAAPEGLPASLGADWTFWQYRLDTRLHGVEGNVDCNRFNGGRQEWEAFLQR
jgi:lysozyme